MCVVLCISLLLEESNLVTQMKRGYFTVYQRLQAFANDSYNHSPFVECIVRNVVANVTRITLAGRTCRYEADEQIK